MPWCDFCSRFFNPNTLTASGNCPRCSMNIGSRKLPLSLAQDSDGGVRQPDSGVSRAESESQKIPWHFWLLAGAGGIYLGWRLIQGIVVLVS